MKNVPVPIPSPCDAAARLDALAAELARHRWVTRLDESSGRLPRLHVESPVTAALSEHVYAQRRRNGTWSYWWPWAQPIAAAPADAAAAIVRILEHGSSQLAA